MKKIIFFIFLVFIIFSFSFPDEKMSEAQLGEKLFFDPILSKDNRTSCSSCHRPEFAFSDTTAFSLGFQGEKTDRNTPSVMNMLSRPYYFYDGRAATLEEQVFHPIRNPKEMNLSVSEVVKRLNTNDLYKKYFKKIYKNRPDSTSIAKAIAAYIRTLESDGTAANDRYLNNHERTAMSSSQIKGRLIFMNKGKCFDCHFTPDFTGDQFRNIGIFDGKKYTDKGRFEVTKDSIDLGKFKVPGLRNVEMTAPYMHNGMFKTLEEVVDYYDNPSNFIKNPINIDTLLQKPLNLSQEEKKDLVNFMKALTDKKFLKN